MILSVKETLVSLSKSIEPEKLIHCLNNLKKEQVDGDFYEILENVLSAIPKIKPNDFSTMEPSLRASLRDISVAVGPENYLKLVACIRSKPSKFLPVLLSPIEDNLQNINLENLLLIATWPDLPASVSMFLAKCALPSDLSHAALSLFSPFLCLLSEAANNGTISPEIENIVLMIIRNKTIMNKLLELLESHDTTKIRSVAGIIVVIGHTQDPKYVPLLGDFLENVGAWNQFAKLILSKERLHGLFARASETGLSEALSRTYKDSNVSGKEFTLLLSEDLDVRKSLSRLLSSRGTLLSILRTLVDPQMVGVFKEMFSDPYLPCRKAAALALSHYKTDLIVPYLKTGLVDPDKHVRDSCANTLKSLLGQEDFHRVIDEMEAETNTLAERLKGLYEWAKESFLSLGSLAKSVLDSFPKLLANVVKKGTAWISGIQRTKKKNNG